MLLMQCVFYLANAIRITLPDVEKPLAASDFGLLCTMWGE